MFTDVAPDPTQRRPYVLGGEDIGSVVVGRVMAQLLAKSERARGPRPEEIAYETVYAEQLRLESEDPDPRTESDRAFVSGLRRELAGADEARARQLLHAIVEHYVQEIAGHFDSRVYQLATRVVPPALSALLHGLALRSRGAFDIEDRVSIDGEVVALQSLVRRGTVILAPNHTSNLDSLVLGSAIHRLDLPPVAYGAGLNLFSNAIVGFFMRHLGGYTVDRKKTDPVYRDTLKTYATVLLERGQHGLFFPGGTRSRSGALESKLKMGLLGTAPIAYRHALESGRPRPRVFVVPCTVTYPLVLEAATLVEEYLRKEGGPRYVDVHDEFDRPRRWLDFLRGLRALDARVHLRISRPLDWLGNPVDDDGTSRDPRGRPVDPARYLLVDGVLAEDAARDAEYTRLLAAALLAAYRRGNTALPTSVVAFVVFEHLRRLRAHSDLFRFLRSIDADTGVPVADVVSDLGRALQQLEQLEREGALHRGDALRTDPRVVLSQALAMFSTYHPVAVLERRGERLHVGDASLLFYYRNRLEGYGLLGTPNLLPGGMVTGRGWGS